MGMLHNRQAGGKITMNEHLEQMWDRFGANIHLWVRVFGRQLSKVADDLTLHIIFKWSEPGHGLIIHRVMQFQELCQLLSFNLNTKMHIRSEWKTGDFSLSLSYTHIIQLLDLDFHALVQCKNISIPSYPPNIQSWLCGIHLSAHDWALWNVQCLWCPPQSVHQEKTWHLSPPAYSRGLQICKS